MKKIGKKLVAVVLAAVMVLCVAPLSGLADLDFAVTAKASGESFTSGIYTYTVDEDGNAIITDCDSTASGEIKIPSKLDGNPVTEIGGNAFADCEGITGVVIPEGVTEIGYDAFCYCTSLASVTIPESVAYIYGYAFAYCYALTSVEIPASVIDLGYDAFYSCENLASVTFAKGSKLNCIGSSAFSHTAITNITIPESVTYIRSYAFAYCKALTSVEIPANVETIEYNAFYYCGNLAAVTFEKGSKLEIIGSNAFAYTAITSIEIPASVTDLNYGVFEYCDSLKNVTFEAGSKLERIGSRTFYGTAITSITLPASLGEVDGYAFYGCKVLTNIGVESGSEYFTSVDGVLFSKDKTGLVAYPAGKTATAYTVPANVKIIGYDAFNDNSVLTSVTLPDGLETIEDSAFYGMDNLTSISIPASVESVGSDAFAYCHSLADIEILGKTTSVCNDSFESTAYYNDSANWDMDENGSKTVFYVGTHLVNANYNVPEVYTVREGTTSIADNAFRYGDITNITLPDSLKRIGYSAFFQTAITSITLPDSLEYIGDSAFAYCYNLKEVVLSDNLNYIGDSAFYSCNVLTTITLPDSLEYIGNSAFSNCVSLTSISIPDNVTLGDYVFNYSTNLATINVGSNVKGIDIGDIRGTAFINNKDNWINGALYLGECLLDVETDVSGKFTVKEGITEIGESAFSSCSGLTEIVLPASVKKIGESAFSMCANLEAINLPDGLEEIGDGAFAACFALKSAVVPSSVKEIGVGVFALDLSLESVTLPAAITEIPELMFAGCIKLKNIPINANTTSIGDAAFAGCTSFTGVDISAKVEKIGALAFAGCSSVAKFTVDSANPNYSSDSYGALFSKDKSVLLSYPSAASAKSYAIPETVKAMEVPFISCKNLESLNIPAAFAADENSDDYEDAIMSLLISTVTMKVDINSLIAKIASFGEETLNSVYEIYNIVEGIEDEEQAIAFINDAVNGVLDYINGIKGVDDVIGRIASLVAEVMEAATLENFKSFTVSKGNPHLYAKDGLLYATAEVEGGEIEKALLTCPAGKTGNIKIDSGVKHIMPAAFALCNVGEIVIPSSVTQIQPATFVLCSAEKLVIPSTVEKLETLAMLLASISEIEIEDGSKIFEEGNYDELSFVACFSDKIILPDSLEIIPEYYFIGSMAKSYELPKKLKAISHYSFAANLLLESIDVPDSVESIGEMAFIGGMKLKDVNISENSRLKLINEMAFTLTSLSDIYIPASTEHIGTFALNPSLGGLVDYFVAVISPELETLFAELAEEGLVLDTEKINATIEHVASWFTNNAGVTVDSRNPYFSSVNGDLYSRDKTTLIKVAETADGLYEIPSSVINIKAGAFAFTGVDEIVVPDSVVSIETGAFAYSPVKELVIGAGVKEIPDSAFGGCTLLKRVTILPSVVLIDEDAFEGCSDDLTIVGYAGSYAYTYAIDNEIKFETIDGTGYVSIKAPSETASAKVAVYGNTMANTKVEIFDGNVKIGEVNSGVSGYWRTTVELNNPTENSTHSLVAKINAGTDKEVVSEAVSVLYSSTVPAFVSITCYHSNQNRAITAETLGIVPKAMSFSSSYSFTYEIKLSAYDGTKTLYVVSGGNKLPAVYDARTDSYIATGYFDENNHSYVPEYVSLELGGCTLANTSFRFPFIIDPSGFVYEAVHSNRVEGATASIFFQDENGLAQLWKDAPIFDQQSTITTDSDGIFKWDVPKGLWQVKVEKEGYETAYSEWLPVPPEQLEVYIGIVSKLAPTVKLVNGYTDSVDVTFNQYMDISTVNSENIVIKDSEGNAISGYWQPVDREVSGKDSSVYYATTFTFKSYYALSGEYTVEINGVENYADKAIEVPYSQTITVKERVSTLNAPDSINVVYGKDYADSEENKITLDGGAAAAGMKVNVALSDNFYVESVSTVTLDENGKATIEVKPVKPGAATITFNLDGTPLVEKTEVIVSMPQETKVTGISISETTAEVYVGAEKQLYANVAPDFATDTAVKWTTSNASVATVDETGRVKGVKAGTATITATTVDGGFTAKCDVKVSLASFTVTWVIDGQKQVQKYNVGAKITAPKAPAKDGFTFKGWTPAVPEVMPAKDLTFTAVYEAASKPSEPTTKPSDPTAKPSDPDNNPDEPKHDENVIAPPSVEVIKYGDAIVLHVDPTKIPKNGSVKWDVSNECFSYTVSDDGITCKASPSTSGDTTFTATIYDEDGNAVSKDEQTLTSKAGFFQKIIAFFKGLFKLNKVYDEVL